MESDGWNPFKMSGCPAHGDLLLSSWSSPEYAGTRYPVSYSELLRAER